LIGGPANRAAKISSNKSLSLLVESDVADQIERVPFLNTYRTMCLALQPDFLRVLEDVRTMQRAA